MSPYINSVKLNDRKFQTNHGLNFKICALVFILLLIGAFYIYFLNLNISVTYKIDKSGAELKNLEDENQLLNIDFSGSYSSTNLKARAESLNLIEVKSAQFLEISDKQLVKK